ncbi:MAG TPA: hypothetical protein PKA14_26285, partial [Leptospiraceae bacterium]|nr:hypothetical protein [Leptospiraceae bacterium]
IQERIMISVKGRYENGKIELNQHPEIQCGRDVIVTFLEEKLNEDSFWDLLNLIDWNQEDTCKERCT